MSATTSADPFNTASLALHHVKALVDLLATAGSLNQVDSETLQTVHLLIWEKTNEAKNIIDRIDGSPAARPNDTTDRLERAVFAVAGAIGPECTAKARAAYAQAGAA